MLFSYVTDIDLFRFLQKSTCSNHRAVDAERSTKGLAATGVGTIDCARHDVKRPTSVGDLQKGERSVLNQ